MARQSAIMVPAVAAGVAVWGSANILQAFVPATGPAAAPRVAPRMGVDGSTPAQDGSTATGTSAAMATLSVGALALTAGKMLAGKRGRAAVTARRAEETPVFAGGLIGNESAFSSGDYNFDPLRLSERCAWALPWFREAELKHGRICMLAWVGLVVPDIVRIPGNGPCYSASVVDAHNACIGEDQVGPLFQVVLFCGIVEMTTCFPKCKNGLTLENAGDYRLGLSFLPKDELKAREMKLKEMKNGRLAMVAFGGAITQAVLSGNSFPWMFATNRKDSAGSGLAASIHAASSAMARGSMRTAMHAEGGYKMSKAVPFLPVSPALEGYVGEEDGFDPMGFSLAIDIYWLREAELKHGRVAMLATLGWMATDLGMRVPGEPFQVSTLEAHDAMVKFGSMPQMLVWLGYFELFGFLAINNSLEGRTDRNAGDFGIRVLYPKDEKSQYDMQLKELRNGRLAMLAFGGIVTAAALTGKTWPFIGATSVDPVTGSFGKGAALCGGLRSPSSIRQGAVAASALPTSASLPFLPKPSNLAGFVGEEQEFDPLGFSDIFDVKWLRESELKHGRVCMVATVGFYAQQYITFPGCPETPNALDAVYTAPPPFMATLLFLAGYIESSSYGGKITQLDMFENSDRVPGDFNFGAGFLKGKSEKEVYDMKLKELNNGRLAMCAFSGMVHHNLVVKGPLFPMFPDGWQGPQGSWDLDSVTGRLNSGQVGGADSSVF